VRASFGRIGLLPAELSPEFGFGSPQDQTTAMRTIAKKTWKTWRKLDVDDDPREIVAGGFDLGCSRKRRFTEWAADDAKHFRADSHVPST
jgi:hypothetical protein